jgi:hypothetical protein
LQAKPMSTASDIHSPSQLLAVAVDAAAAAARVIEAAARQPSDLVWKQKGESDFVTDVDTDAEAAVVATIRSHYPRRALSAKSFRLVHRLATKVWCSSSIRSTERRIFFMASRNTRFLSRRCAMVSSLPELCAIALDPRRSLQPVAAVLT